MLMPDDILTAKHRIDKYIVNTPVLRSDLLNEITGHNIFFKMESFQITGAFKVRGVLNYLCFLKERNMLPSRVVTYSSGNHAQAIAWASRMLDIRKVRVYMAKDTSNLKQQSTRELGAEVTLTGTRAAAEERAYLDGLSSGTVFIHPSDNDLVIAGAGTLTYEALKTVDNVDAVFAACGGGALVSGCYLASKLFEHKPDILAAEPKTANDASISYKKGKIFRFSKSPTTIADGARTLGLSARTFNYIKKINGIFEIEEKDIIYWTAWLSHLLNISCEPTSAMPMAAGFNWLEKQVTKKNILVIISGGNVDQKTNKVIWNSDHLNRPPTFKALSVLT
jgi:threonine dehydratase